MMNLMHWRLLVAVADAGNISKAADQFGITQSGASQAIAQTEDSLGVQIFVRDRRQTTPTAVGEQVLKHVREMLSSLEAIRGVAENAKGLQRGRIKLACFPSVFALLLPPLLRNFRRLHPSIEIVALEGTDEEVEAWLAGDTIDLGVVMNPAPERHAFHLGRDAWVAIVPNGHPIANRPASSKVALRELVDEPFILATGGCTVHGHSLTESAGLRLSDIRITVRDWVSAFNLVREGMGVALVPESTLPSDRRGVRIYHLKSPIYRSFGLICSPSGAASPATRALLDMVRAQRLDEQPISGHGRRGRPPVNGWLATT